MKAILWREWLLFRRQFWKITAAALTLPSLYMLAFGWGLGERVQLPDQSYISFIVPGIMALATMNISFSAVAVKLNIEKVYEKNLELMIMAPLRMPFFALAKISTGMLRGLYAASLICALAYLFGVSLQPGIQLLLLVVINCLVFSALGFLAGMTVSSHQDLNRVNSFALVPMAFLCGTFFPLDQVPALARHIILALPLTHSVQGMRAVASGAVIPSGSLAILALYFLLFLGIGTWLSYRLDASS